MRVVSSRITADESIGEPSRLIQDLDVAPLGAVVVCRS